MTLSNNIAVYGKSIPPTAKNTVNLKLQKNTGFKYPLSDDSNRGYFSKETGINLVKNNLRNLLRTEPGERFMLPQYGCGLRKYLMEPLDEVTFSQVRDTISTSIYKYLSKISIAKLQILQVPSGQIKINLFCNLKDVEAINFNFNFEL